MGGKVKAKTEEVDTGEFLAAMPQAHHDHAQVVYALMVKHAPEGRDAVKWKTLARDYRGTLFAVSAGSNHVNLYVLTTGVLANHKSELAGIPHSACCLRLALSEPVPVSILEPIMAEAAARKR